MTKLILLSSVKFPYFSRAGVFRHAVNPAFFTVETIFGENCYCLISLSGCTQARGILTALSKLAGILPNNQLTIIGTNRQESFSEYGLHSPVVASLFYSIPAQW